MECAGLWREEELKSGEVSLGTTIIAIKFSGGVVLGADTRTSMGTYVSNRVSKKITKLADGIYTCRSGSAADTQAVADFISEKIKEKNLCYGERPLVSDVATLAKKIIYNNPRLTAGLIIAGVDKYGPQVYSIPLGGSVLRQECAVAGSGSVYITGLCDRLYRSNMTKEEAIDFVKIAVSHAIHRDNSSGGCIRMIVIDSAGTEEEMFIKGHTVQI